MALRALIAKKKLSEKTKQLEEVRAKLKDLETREAELEAAIDEAETEEDKAVVNEAVETYEAEKVEAEKAEADLKREVEELENELKETSTETAEPEKRSAEPIMEKETKKMQTREFFKLSREERDAFFASERVQAYLGEVRSAISEKRAVTNAGLTIPTEFLGLIRENIENYSKLYSRVFVRQLSGNGRAAIMGTIPEAVWTEACANLNELSLSFYDVEFGCWKVGGYFGICNATLEDSDIDLASELITSIGQAIGYALDKAILYGTGTRMPLGIVTRLAQTSEPAGYPTTARPWVDLHTSNIASIDSDTPGVGLFSAIALKAAAAKGKYSRGEKTWVMNENTYSTLIASAMSINAAGAIVTGIGGTMPVIGGDIVVLNFVPNNVIIGGYFDLYTLAERAGEKFATSEHVRFLQDQTVMKGTARYDGTPVIAEGFVAIGLNDVTPNASMTFAPDEANL